MSADVVGPISPESLGGANYFLTVVDTASRYAWLRNLKVKSQAEQELKAVVNQIENKLGKRVQRIITDGGGEFVNKDMKDWLKEKGITQLITTRNTPQNNGTAERMNRTIMEKARTIRIEANLTKQLWGELLSTATFLYNRNTKTNPYLRMWGIEPKLDHIRPIGAEAWYSVHHFEKIGKLDPRCEKGVLIGFDAEMRSYRIWNPETKKVVRSRDVSFREIVDNDIGEIQSEGIEERTQPETINQETEQATTPTEMTTNEEGEQLEEEIIDSQLSSQNQEGKKTRSSTRTKQSIERYGNWKTYLSRREQDEEENQEDRNIEATAMQKFVKENTIVPDSFKTAKNSTEWPSWRKAIFTELDSIIENGVFEIVSKEKRDKSKTLINTRWVLNKKFDTEGNLKRYKARCVARGFKQKEGIDYEETFSPTGRLSTMRYVLHHAAQRKIRPRQAGFVTAYLNSKLEDEEAVYISLPEGFV